MPTISLIAAMSIRDRVIGNNNTLPWHLPADLAHFKAMTLNKPIVMGRKTFESIGRPLPSRQNIVVTRQSDLAYDGCLMADSITSAIQCCDNDAEIMIIGGAQLYRQTIEKADRLYLTLVDAEIDGDATFPAWQPDDWHVISEEAHSADAKNAYGYTFLMLERR